MSEYKIVESPQGAFKIYRKKYKFFWVRAGFDMASYHKTFYSLKDAQNQIDRWQYKKEHHYVPNV